MIRKLSICAVLVGAALPLGANPEGGDVAAGSATIAGQGSPTVTVNQASNTAIINWQSFSIGAGEATKFIQPSSTSAALNRVLGGQTSIIDGTLSANGRIFLLNGNGILVGQNGVITTAGFTGSTRNITDSDFLSGNLHFVGSSEGGVTNYGKISALGGDVVLIGKTVDNEGTITASGTAALAAGDDVLLAQMNADGSTVTVNPVASPTPATDKVGVKNSGTIKASAAELKAANGNIYALAIQNDGVVQATTVKEEGGHIFLTSDAGTIVNSGTLDASATAAKGHGGSVVLKSKAGKVVHSGKIVAKGGQGGAGGNAEISGKQIGFTGTVDLTAPGGTTGNLLLDPATLNVIDGGSGTVTGGQNDDSSTISPTTVDNALNSANLTLDADNNITITNAITWTSGNTLTLQTNNSGSTMNINAAITGTSGGLTINAASPTDAITTSLAGTIDVSSFILETGAWKQLINVDGNGGNLPQTMVDGSAQNLLPAFTASNDFEIQIGTFLRASSGDGGSNHYQLEDIYGIQGMAGFLTSNFTGNGSYIDASVTSNWNGGAGFSPIGNLGNPYQGSIDYLYIQSLTINRPEQDYVGLLGVLGNNGSISDVGIYSANVTGGNYVGTLVGENRGQIDNSSASDGSVTGNEDVGGLIGYQDRQGGSITFLIATGTGSGSGTSTGDNNEIYTSDATVTDVNVTGNSYVGGLVGETASSIEYSTVTSQGEVPTTVTGNYNVGGVAGYISPDGSVTYSTFEGQVTYDDTRGESSDFGGIAGENDGTITNSNVFPNSSITGDEYVGGIAGYNDGFISDSYNSGSVNGVVYEGEDENDGGNRYVGGIAGYNNGYASDGFNGGIQTSYNTGAVTGGTYVGGLVGYNAYLGTINTCYNVGSVTGDSYVGGVAGYNDGYVYNVYNSGFVSGTDTGTGTGTGTDSGTGTDTGTGDSSDSVADDPSGNTGTVGGIVGYGDDDSDVEHGYWDTSTTGQSRAVGTNNGYEHNVVTVNSSTAYTIAGNNGSAGNDGDGAGYSYFGGATAVSGTNGVYAIMQEDGSPDDGGPSWYIIEGETRPMLAMEFNSEINNPHSLQLMAVGLNNTYDITHNIDLSVISNPSEVWNQPVGQGFVPIGADPDIAESGNVAFTGTIYGEYYTISSLFIDRSESDDVGLIGYAGSGSDIFDVYLNNSTVTGHNNVGALVGVNHGYIYQAQSGNSGDGGFVTGSQNIGGLVGDNFGTVEQSSLTSSVGVPVVTGGENVGGIAGNNEEDATLSQDLNSGNVATSGSTGSSFGGIAGINSGAVSQSINYGAVGSGVEANVGGLVGDNFGQVDDSYSGSIDGATISGSGFVGGLVGVNESTGTVETSYSLSPVQSSSPSTTGALIGVNGGTALHSYYDNQTAGQEVAIGTNNDTEDTTDVPADGFTTAQLTDARNFAQGSSPELWDFSPRNGESQGIWAIDAYNRDGQINSGLPVLQWQYPADAQVTATNGQQYYGYQPGYTVTGDGATDFPHFVPSPTFNVSGDPNAGGTQQIVVSGTPNTYNNNYNYEVEYVNGTTTIVPDPITIVANSYNISSGSPEPTYTVTYNGFQPNGSPEDLNGELEFTVTPPGAADGLHTITPSGLFSSNYDITYVNGVLNVGTPSPGQTLLTFETELQNIQDAFGKDPTNGLDPIYFLIFPNIPGLGGDEAGAINDPADAYLAYASGTSTLPAFDRLVTPGVGVVEIIDGVVIVGNPTTGNPIYISNPNGGLPIEVTTALQGILSADVYKQLLPYASH